MEIVSLGHRATSAAAYQTGQAGYAVTPAATAATYTQRPAAAAATGYETYQAAAAVAATGTTYAGECTRTEREREMRFTSMDAGLNRYSV